MSIESRKKMRLAKLGKPSPLKGKTISKETKRKISETQKGKRNSPKTEFKKGVYAGKIHRNWKGGIARIRSAEDKLRSSKEYRLWRKAVLERDKYTCIWCGFKEDLHVDHIKSFIDYPELRFAIDNGRILCRTCHIKTDTYGKIRKK